MKFCAKCGTQISDEVTVCPQCQTPTEEQHHPNTKQQSSDKKSRKIWLIILIYVVATIAISVATYFVLSHCFNDTNNTFTSTASSICPDDEYGNHSWTGATCEHPAYCINCGEYKDDKLGYHKFEYNDDTCLIECFICGLLKDDYDKQN